MNLRSSVLWRRGLGAVALLGSLLVGCAVLTVDVDVYKGALVNEKQVQLHQLVALATAAKPMLVQLRDKLEWPSEDGTPYPKYPTCSLDWYQPLYIRPQANDLIPSSPGPGFFDEALAWFNGKKEDQQENQPGCPQYFEDIRARLVNGVLSLYEDLDSPDFSPHGARLRDIVSILDRTIPNPQADEAAFKKISSGFKSDSDLINEGLYPLKQGYAKFLVASDTSDAKYVPRRNIDPLMKALSGTRRANKFDTPTNTAQGTMLEKKLIQYWSTSTGPLTDKDLLEKQSPKEEKEVHNTLLSLYDRRLARRASWKYLGEEKPNSLLAQASADLCKDNKAGEESCKTLLEYTKKLVDNYWDSRQATHDLWEEGLNLLVLIQRPDQSQSERYSKLRQELLDLVLHLTSVHYVASALDRVQGTDGCAVLKSLSVLDLMCAPTSNGPLRWTENNVKNDRPYFEEALRKALTVHPEETAYFLLYLDSIEQNALPSDGDAAIRELIKTANETVQQRPVRLGLTLSLVDKNDQLKPTTLFQLVNQVSHGLAQGFERGRPVEGLHRLTETFLASHDGTNRTSEGNDQRKLTNALIQFAQKVLFLANHDWLVSPPRNDGLILGGGNNLLRGLFGDYLADSLSRSSFLGFGTSRVPQAEEQAYIRVLQAVGNSILFSTNELPERVRYDEESKAKVQAEVDAANAAYSANAMTLVDDLLTELKRDKEAAVTGEAAAQKEKIELEKTLGHSTANQETGLHREKAISEQILTDAKNEMGIYRTSLRKLEAIHGLLTKEIIQQVNKQWNAGQTDPSKITDFLTDTNGLSLQKALEKVRDRPDSTLSPDDTQRWTDALAYVGDSVTATSFTAYLDTSGQISWNRSDLFDAFVKHVEELNAKRLAQIKQYEAKLGEKQAALDRLNQEIARLTTEVTRLVALIAELPKEKASLEIAHASITTVRSDLLNEVENHNQFVSPKAIYLLVSSHLKRKEDAANDQQKKAPYQVAQKVLAQRTAPPGIPDLDPKKYQNPRDVIDRVIAVLRYRHMKVVERSGKGSKEEEKATEALESAYRHRAGMIYIRPTSAYLRTSSPSTSLQDDPNLAWDNMLLKQGLRNIPFSSELRDILNPTGKQDRSITSELDKQYWQNINRVRVSGAGFTNQALVKDDVGNWYVKQYFGDTEKIWESAKNLALFSLGAKVPVDLAKQLQKSKTPEELTRHSNEQPTLQKLLDKHQGAYKSHTDEVQAKLEQLHTKAGTSELESRIIAAWNGNADIKETDFESELKTALKAQIQEWDKAVSSLKDKKDQDPGQAIVRDIRALARLDKNLSAQISGMSLPDKLKDKPVKTQAANVLHGIVKPLVFDLLEERKQALGRYEQAITFIGDAANPKEQDAKPSSLKYEDIRK